MSGREWVRLLALAAGAVALGLGAGRLFESSSMSSLIITSCLVGLWFGRKNLRFLPEIAWMIALTLGIIAFRFLLVQAGCEKHV